MVSADLAKVAFDLPPEQRLDLARRLVESVVTPEPLTEALAEGIRRIEEVATGRVPGLTEAQPLHSDTDTATSRCARNLLTRK